MKLQPVGLVFSLFVSLGLISFSCASGDTVDGGTGTGNTTGSGSAGTTGSGNRAGTTGTGNTTGSAGTTGSGTGNVTGSAGTTGTGTGNVTGSGTAGTTGTTGTCITGNSTTPSAPLITDFSDAMPDAANPGDFKFGSVTGELGGTSLFSSSTVGTLSVTGGALTFAATVAAPSTANMFPYNGFVVYINGPACVNASGYTGVKFTISAVTGNCNIVFSFGDADHTTPTADPSRGICTGTNCYASQYAVTASTTSVLFSATPSNAGMPTATVDAAKFTGVQWQFQDPSTTSCTGSMTVDNISFE